MHQARRLWAARRRAAEQAGPAWLRPPSPWLGRRATGLRPGSELHAVVTQRQIPLPLPRLRQFRFLETQILEHGERRGLQLRDLPGIRHVGDFLLEEIVLAPGKFRELLHALLGLTLLRQHQLLCDLGNFLLLHVPQRVARPVFARQAFDIRQGFDIGELARLLLFRVWRSCGSAPRIAALPVPPSNVRPRGPCSFRRLPADDG